MPAPERFAAINPQISLAALHDRMIVFAQDKRGDLIHVDAAQRGKACNCRCLACDEALIARQGDIKAHSFAHASGTECQFAVDAVLNRLAQELIAAAGVFVSPPLSVRAACTGPFGLISQEEAIAPSRLRVESVCVDRRVHKQRPSVVLVIGGRELLLELTYGHRLDAGKRGAIEKLGIAAIEMHVSEGMFDTVEQFGHQLLEDAGHKHWIFNPKASAIQVKLDALVAEELAQQEAQQARARDAAREREAARQRAIKRALEENWRAQAQQDQMLRQAQVARPTPVPRQEAGSVHLPTLHYRLRDGGVLLRHQQDGGILLVPETGNEAVLHAFAELGLQFSAECGGYRARTDQLESVVLALRPFQLAVKSI